MGAVTKSYMRKGFLIYEEMRKCLPMYGKAEKDTKYVSRLRFIVTAIQFINSIVHTYTQWT